jgi:hypothetical protein
MSAGRWPLERRCIGVDEAFLPTSPLREAAAASAHCLRLIALAGPYTYREEESSSSSLLLLPEDELRSELLTSSNDLKSSRSTPGKSSWEEA